ncbi:MAG: BREX-1 system phosphatase PglZ type A [Nitrospirae bacterium]|nr:BREX-1 system phosphatase PglZ type A [Nitrospirota bacterium]
MNIERIKERLAELFLKHRVVFWNDPEREFEEMLPSMGFDGPDGNDDINILRPEMIGQLKTKVIIELERPGDKFLVYSAAEIPRPEDDWLLDVRLYSYQFYADTASMIVEELGLRTHSLREHIAKRKKFFANRQRMAQLKKIIAPGDRSEDIDRKILAVLVKADSDRFFDIIHSLYTSFPFEEGLDSIPARFVDIQKMELEDVFWRFAREAFGYQSEQPNTRHLLTCLLVSDLHISIGPALPENVRQFVLPGNFGRDAAVCMSEWRDSVKMAASYDCLSEMVAEAVCIERYLKDVMDLDNDDKVFDAIKGAVTFFAVEKLCAGRIKTYVREHRDTLDKDSIISFCRLRQEKHWANRRLGDEYIPREALWSVYEAIIAATTFIDRKNSFPRGFSYANSKGIFDAYITDLHEFDRQYRLFSEYAGIADSKGWAVLKDLKDEMEDLYQNWFLETLAILWEEKASLDNWCIDGVTNQYDFFGKYPERKAGDKNAAVFVIVSDALRYEAGVEVSEALNGRYRFKARIEPMLGCVPSYTALGMAALLPHTRLVISDKGDVLVDGRPCAGIEQRSDILSVKKGLAIKCEDLIRMSREDARELVRGKNIVYVYHNTIDALGDDARTENKTFSAVHKAIDEVCDIVSFVMNQLNARFVFVSADHGFIYSEKSPDATIRNTGRDSDIKFNGEIFKTNKRFITGKKISGNEDVHRGNVSLTAGISSEKDMQFVVPKGISLFYFTGGARYFHGGMSLQEVVIPVITVEQVRGDEKDKTREKTVGLQVLGQDHRITTGRHRFEIIQTDAVSERIRAVTYKIGIYAGNEPVSDIQTLKFDSVSQEMVDRKKEVVLTLKNMAFPVGKQYRLIFRNAATDIEDMSIPVRIDRAFTSDF